MLHLGHHSIIYCFDCTKQFLGGLVFLLFVPITLGQTVPNLSVSNDTTFRVLGKSLALRASVLEQAESITKDLAKLLDEQTTTQGIEILISLQDAERAQPHSQPFRQEIREIGGRYLLQLNVSLQGGFDRKSYALECIELLLHKYAIDHSNEPISEIQLQVPPWLTHGLMEAMLWQSNKAERIKYEMLKNHPKLYDSQKLLVTSSQDFDQLNGVLKEIFQASAAAMVLGLLQQTNGKQGFVELLKRVATFEGEIEDLLYGQFPGLNTGKYGLHKWWALQVAVMSLPKLSEVYSLLESEQRLNELLVLSVRDETGQLHQTSLQNYPKFIAMTAPERTSLLVTTKQQLIRLNYRCFPNYRPIIVEYLRLLQQWQSGQDTNSAVMLERLSSERELMVTAAKRTRDYLDWYIIANANELKGDFKAYEQLKHELAKERELQKDELIDPYLDRIQTIWRSQTHSEIIN